MERWCKSQQHQIFELKQEMTNSTAELNLRLAQAEGNTHTCKNYNCTVVVCLCQPMQFLGIYFYLLFFQIHIKVTATLTSDNWNIITLSLSRSRIVPDVMKFPMGSVREFLQGVSEILHSQGKTFALWGHSDLCPNSIQVILDSKWFLGQMWWNSLWAFPIYI